jgi:hypothetical protein
LKKLPRSGILRRVRGLPVERVECPTAPHPRRIGEDKLLVWGPDSAGDLLQVIFVLDEDGSAYVLHARSLTEREKRRYRRQRR